MNQLEISSPASLRRMVKVEKGRSNGVAATTKGHFHQKQRNITFTFTKSIKRSLSLSSRASKKVNFTFIKSIPKRWIHFHQKDRKHVNFTFIRIAKCVIKIQSPLLLTVLIEMLRLLFWVINNSNCNIAELYGASTSIVFNLSHRNWFDYRWGQPNIMGLSTLPTLIEKSPLKGED